jgi:outer membrane protein OmpA-like peptidoglycan-associated protein
MANILDDDNEMPAAKSSGKGWLIFGAGLLAAFGFGWHFLNTPDSPLLSVFGGASSSEQSASAASKQPLTSGKISTGGNESAVTSVPDAKTDNGDLAANAAAAARNAAMGKLQTTPTLAGAQVVDNPPPTAAPTPAPIPTAAPTAAPTPAKTAAAAGQVTAKTDAVAKAPATLTAPSKMAAVDSPTPSLKMDKEFRSLLYAVFYRWASAEMGPNASKTVAKLVPEALKGVRIVLTGRTDSTGDMGLNKVLAERRANAIKSAFVSKGVNAGIIESNINTSGETKLNEGTVTPLLPSAGNSRARRVDIYIEAKDGNGGGMKPK